MVPAFGEDLGSREDKDRERCGSQSQYKKEGDRKEKPPP
jgi:hypothetical protein